MKKIIATLFLTVFSCTVLLAQAKKDITGTWLTGSGKAKVIIEKTGDRYNGHIVWLKTPLDEAGKPKVDKNNPDAKRKNDPLMGLKLLRNFKHDGGDKWSDGKIYDPENGKEYSCNITLRDDKMDVRGYVGISLIGRTDTWFRVADIKK